MAQSLGLGVCIVMCAATGHVDRHNIHGSAHGTMLFTLQALLVCFLCIVNAQQQTQLDSAQHDGSTLSLAHGVMSLKRKQGRSLVIISERSQTFLYSGMCL